MACPVCMDNYSPPKALPRVLPCGHSMCSACLVRVSQNSRRVQCPLDREYSTWVAELGTKQFPLNHALVAALHLEDKSEAKPRKVVACDACTKPQSLVFCEHCSAYLCRDCDHFQHTSSFLAKHVRTPVDKYVPKRICTVHPSQHVRYVCSCNKQPVCDDCLVVGQHRHHAHEPLATAADEAKRRISDAFARVQEQVWEVEHAMPPPHVPDAAISFDPKHTSFVDLSPSTLLRLVLSATALLTESVERFTTSGVYAVLEMEASLAANIEALRVCVAVMKAHLHAHPVAAAAAAEGSDSAPQGSPASEKKSEQGHGESGSAEKKKKEGKEKKGSLFFWNRPSKSKSSHAAPASPASSSNASAASSAAASPSSPGGATATTTTTTTTTAALVHYPFPAAETILNFVAMVKQVIPPFLSDCLGTEVVDVLLYPSSSPCKLLNGMSLTYAEGSWFLVCLDDKRLKSLGLWAVSRCLPLEEETLLPSGEFGNLTDLCRMAIAEDGKNYFAYNAITFGMTSKASVVMADGSVLTTIQLLTECIHLNSDYAHPYQNLANCLEEDETVVLFNGRSLNKQQLYWEAQRCDPMYHVAYNGLGNCVRSGGVLLSDGRFLSKKELFIEAISLKQDYSHAYFNLACMGGYATLHDGRTLNERQLYVEALRCDPRYAYAYNNLALLLNDRETVTMADGRALTKRQLYLEALACNESYSYAYNNLGVALGASETIILHNGRLMTKKQLFIEAMRCDHSYKQAARNLAHAMSETETVSLLDGRTMTRQELLEEADRDAAA